MTRSLGATATPKPAHRQDDEQNDVGYRHTANKDLCQGIIHETHILTHNLGLVTSYHTQSHKGSPLRLYKSEAEQVNYLAKVCGVRCVASPRGGRLVTGESLSGGRAWGCSRCWQGNSLSRLVLESTVSGMVPQV